MPLSSFYDPDSAVSSLSWLAFRSLQVQFPGLAHSFTSCQLVVKVGMSNHVRLDIRRFGLGIRIHLNVRIV